MELPSGGSFFKNITLDKTIKSPGSVQWDGTYMTIMTVTKAGDNYVIYRFTVSGRRGTVFGSTQLLVPHYLCPLCGWFLPTTWIQGDVVVGPLIYDLAGLPPGGNVCFWHYPAGGRLFKDINDIGAHSTGVAIGLAPK